MLGKFDRLLCPSFLSLIDRSIINHNKSLYRAISAARRGIEPDHYVFQVPDHEEGPLGPLRITDPRGNIRKESSTLFR